MPAENSSKMVNLCPVFLSNDVRRTVQFYTEKLGFHSAKHYDKIENFATIYRDEIEFVIIQAQKETVTTNLQRYGIGSDAYIDPANVAGVDPLYEEFKSKGVKIVEAPHMTDYGSYEFTLEDIDGRYISIGRIKEKEVYFTDSDLDIAD